MQGPPTQPDDRVPLAPLAAGGQAGATAAPMLPGEASGDEGAPAGWLLLLAMLWGASVGVDYLLAPQAWMGPAALGLLFAIAGGVWLIVEGAHRRVKLLVFFLVGASLFRTAYLLACPYDLTGPEAIAWELSRRIGQTGSRAWMLPSSWLIAAGTALFGDTALGVRAPAVVTFFLASVAMYRLGVRLHGQLAGASAAALLQVVPLTGAWSLAMTPTQPLLACWVAAWLLLHRAATGGRPRDWLLLGAVTGVGLCCSEAMALLWLGGLAWLLGSRARRAHFRGPWVYVSVLLAAVCCLPLLDAEQRRGWLSLNRYLASIEATMQWDIDPAALGRLLGWQVLTVTPIVAALGAWAAVRVRRLEGLSAWAVLPGLVGMSLICLVYPVNALTTGVAWATALPALAAATLVGLHARPALQRRVIKAGVVLAVLGTVAAYVLPVLPLPRQLSAAALSSARQLAKEAARLQAGLSEPRFVLAEDPATAAQLAFYMPSRPRPYVLPGVPGQGRHGPGAELCGSLLTLGGYDVPHVWDAGRGQRDRRGVTQPGYDALYVPRPGHLLPDRLRASFRFCEARTFTLRDTWGRSIREQTAYLCTDFRGLAEESPASMPASQPESSRDSQTAPGK